MVAIALRKSNTWVIHDPIRHNLIHDIIFRIRYPLLNIIIILAMYR